jgi:hypothetical protein
MNAPLPNDLAHGTTEALREFVYEQLWYVARLVEVAHLHAETGDDDGLRRDVRRMVAYMRAIIATVAELPNRGEDMPCTASRPRP